MNAQPTAYGIVEVVCEPTCRSEIPRVHELIIAAHNGGPGVLGLEATLQAVMGGRVYVLMVAHEFVQPGWECTNCRLLGSLPEGSCSLCRGALKGRHDIVQPLQARVLDLGGEVEVLRGAESRHALAQYGSIGALLRYAYVSPLIAIFPCAARSNLSFTVIDARFALDQFAPYIE